MFAVKAGAYTNEAPFRCSTLGLTHKYKTRLERLAMDKRSSLFGLIFSDEEKKFYDIDTWSSAVGDADGDVDDDEDVEEHDDVFLTFPKSSPESAPLVSSMLLVSLEEDTTSP